MDIVIFEDQMRDRTVLENIVMKEILPTFDAELILSTGDIERLSEQIAEHERPTVYLMDIMVGDDNYGFLFARKIRQRNRGDIIVYITDYPNVWFDTLDAQMQAFVCIKKSRRLSDKLIELFMELSAMEPKPGYFISHGQWNGYQIPYNEIVYVQTVKGTRYIEVITEHGSIGPIPNFGHTFSELNQLLSEDFIQISRCTIINKTKCRRWTRGYVEMTNGIRLARTGKYRKGDAL